MGFLQVTLGCAVLCAALYLQKWGWVQEMYAFAISVYLIGVRHVDLALHLMAQPPWDARMELSANKPFYILHYTYGNDFTLDGKYTPGGWVVQHPWKVLPPGQCAWLLLVGRMHFQSAVAVKASAR